MLDPYLLNRCEANRQDILDVESHCEHDYYQLFIEESVTSPWGTAVAIYPRRQITRLASQHGLFTLHLRRNAL